MTIYEEEITEEILICPYCGDDLAETWSSCCGEAGHGAKAYLMSNGDIWLEHEVSEIKAYRPLTDEERRARYEEDLFETYRDSKLGDD